MSAPSPPEAQKDWRTETAFGYWLSLPWRCKLRHRIIRMEWINENTLTPEQVWFECERCGHWGGHG